MTMMKKISLAVISILIMFAVFGFMSVDTKASDFDPAFYAAQYPDVVAAYGNDPNALYSHYINFGIKENRFKNAEEAASGISYSASAPENNMTYVDVDISNQQMVYYVNGVPVLTSAVVTGNANNGNSTPTGVFFINAKVPGKYLVGPTWNVWVDRWMRFTGNVGLHDASWRSEFGGNIYQVNGSHGCVNLPSDVAKNLYDLVEIGTMVKVH